MKFFLVIVLLCLQVHRLVAQDQRPGLFDKFDQKIEQTKKAANRTVKRLSPIIKYIQKAEKTLQNQQEIRSQISKQIKSILKTLQQFNTHNTTSNTYQHQTNRLSEVNGLSAILAKYDIFNIQSLEEYIQETTALVKTSESKLIQLQEDSDLPDTIRQAAEKELSQDFYQKASDLIELKELAESYKAFHQSNNIDLVETLANFRRLDELKELRNQLQVACSLPNPNTNQASLIDASLEAYKALAHQRITQHQKQIQAIKDKIHRFESILSDIKEMNNIDFLKYLAENYSQVEIKLGQMETINLFLEISKKLANLPIFEKHPSSGNDDRYNVAFKSPHKLKPLFETLSNNHIKSFQQLISYLRTLAKDPQSARKLEDLTSKLQQNLNYAVIKYKGDLRIRRNYSSPIPKVDPSALTNIAVKDISESVAYLTRYQVPYHEREIQRMRQISRVEIPACLNVYKEATKKIAHLNLEKRGLKNDVEKIVSNLNSMQKESQSKIIGPIKSSVID